MEMTPNNTEIETNHDTNLAVEMKRIAGIEGRISLSDSGKSFNIFNPIVGVDTKHLASLAIKAGFDTIISKPAGTKYKDRNGDDQVSEAPLLIVTNDSKALKSTDDLVSAMMEMRMNS